mmetsp:Transcript_27512/g.57415  ORF Transcript_27512/g.57415 Transcript_27512/m.57415 type:complete len:180 (+) Transcript_27512:100-639(+)
MTRFSLIVIAFAVKSASAFAPATVPLASHHATASTATATTAVHLVPEQARQLVAYSQNYHSKKAKESASKASSLTHSSRRRSTNDNTKKKKSSSMLGSLVHRILHVGDDHHHIEEELNPLHHPQDEVMYPIVGFSLVDGHAVPSVGQEAPACRLLEVTDMQEEVPFGYWSTHGGDSLWV